MNEAGKMAMTRRGVRRSSNASEIQSLDKNRLQFFLGVHRASAVTSVASLLLCVFALSACSVTRGTRTPDGTLTVSNWRLLWSSELVDFSVHQPSTLNSQPTFNARLIIGKSVTDADAVGAVAEGAVKALTRP